jgi:hypothetical protein
MPIKGDRLRWPPRPGKKFAAGAALSGGRRSLSSDQQSTNRHDPLLQPNDRDNTAVQSSNAPRDVTEQAHDDSESGKGDTDRRHQTAQDLTPTPDG